jgi:hypothetical protein
MSDPHGLCRPALTLRWPKIHGASWVTGVPISALWNPKMLTPALTYINCLAKPEQS